MRYRNGTVLPSALLKDSNSPTTVGFNKNYQNFPLRAGIVVQSYAIDDPKNVTKLAPEYDVVVLEQDAGRAIVPITYRNCLSSNSFGAIADYFEARLRTQKKVKSKQTGGKDFAGQDGAIVLLLCLDGSSEKAIIIGALNHPDRKSKLKGDEQVLAGEFNGLSISVADDGSAKLSFKGATDNEGKPKDESQGTTTIDIEKDGSIQFKHKGAIQRIEKGGNFLLQNEGSTTTDSKKDISFKTNANFNVEAKSDGNFKLNKLVLEAQGSASMKAQSFDISGQSKIDLKGQMVSVEAQSMVKVKGAQITLDGMVFLGGAGGTPAVTLSTKVFAIGNLGAPIVGNLIGPFSSKVFVAG